jgi:hypothetical protein
MQLDSFTHGPAELLVGIAGTADRLAIRGAINDLIAKFSGLDDKLTPKDLPTEHVFAPGVYLRSVFMKRGEIWIGKIHRHPHGNIVSQGKASVITEFGHSIVEAHSQFVAPAGTQRVLVILEDMIWTCVHANPDNITDLEKLEEMFIVKDHLSLENNLPELIA